MWEVSHVSFMTHKVILSAGVCENFFGNRRFSTNTYFPKWAYFAP